ncbi:unnamed protein product [Linum tenue]|uniref:Uncharacterized protein n=1 Tax=Linum tenue TaxID=586396 RepID=A0AAV0NL84_9ROSI|nr:unnamed protein product [Linum tenue]
MWSSTDTWFRQGPKSWSMRGLSGEIHGIGMIPRRSIQRDS